MSTDSALSKEFMLHFGSKPFMPMCTSDAGIPCVFCRGAE